jgi:hypothetical protein
MYDLILFRDALIQHFLHLFVKYGCKYTKKRGIMSIFADKKSDFGVFWRTIKQGFAPISAEKVPLFGRVEGQIEVEN